MTCKCMFVTRHLVGNDDYVMVFGLTMQNLAALFNFAFLSVKKEDVHNPLHVAYDGVLLILCSPSS